VVRWDVCIVFTPTEARWQHHDLVDVSGGLPRHGDSHDGACWRAHCRQRILVTHDLPPRRHLIGARAAVLRRGRVAAVHALVVPVVRLKEVLGADVVDGVDAVVLQRILGIDNSVFIA
jgi:hypothetical protein